MKNIFQKLITASLVIVLIAMAVILVTFSYGLVRQAILHPDGLVITKGCK